MLLYAVRFFFVVLVLQLTWTFIDTITRQGTENQSLAQWLLSGGLVLAAVVMLIEWITPRKSLRAMGGLFFGLIVGMVISYGLSLVVDLIVVTMTPQDWPPEPVRKAFISSTKVLFGLIACYFCVSFVLQTKDDFRFIIPYVEFSKQAKGARPILLDTSTIIDGRIADVCNTGIFDAPLIVPRFVLQELQTVADSGDRLKRNRGRRGLDILNQLQRNDKVDVDIIEPRFSRKEASEDVDQKLISMALELEGRLITSDFNLAKVAQLRGVDVINLNDIGNALKPSVLPGEALAVKVVKPGAEPSQGVGYLEDGTLVVIESARDKIGHEVHIVVTSELQTSAGRMLFGRLDEPAGATRSPRPRREDARGTAIPARGSDGAPGPAESPSPPARSPQPNPNPDLEA
jgi:uncharacterized protein YacL